MKKEVIGEASTIEEAKEKAVMLLAAPADADITFEIVAMPQKKVLGLFGGSPAKVKASYDDGKAEPKQEQKPAPVEVKKPQPKAEKPKAEKTAKAEKPKKEEKKASMPKQEKKAASTAPAQAPEKAAQPETKKKAESAYPSDEVTAECSAYLKDLLAGLQVQDAVIQAQQSDEGLYLEIGCEDYGIIIGRRGETLDSIQYLVSLVANKGAGDYIRVTIDVGNYREKRQETLRRLAQKNASHVLRNGRRVVLEPMNPYERRIIHTAVQEIEGVLSRSVGSNNERRVIIELEEGVKPTGGRDREERGERRGRGDYNRSGRGGSRPAAQAAPARKLTKEELPKFGKIQ